MSAHPLPIRFRRIIIMITLLLMFSHQEFCFAATSGGTVIVNTASLTFNAGKVEFSVVSDTVSTQITNVDTLTVTPKQNTANAPSDVFVTGQVVTRFFTITNTGNVPDAYVVSGISASVGSVVGLTFVSAGGSGVPITQGQTVSPTVNPGQSIGVQVVISTQGVASGTRVVVTLTARSSVAKGLDGPQSDTGSVVGIVAQGVSWGAPTSGSDGGSSLTPVSLVNGSRSIQTGLGSNVIYTIAFENYGGVTATNVQLLDNVPVGITPDLSSVTLNGVHVSGARITSQVLNSQSHNGSALADNGRREPLSGQVLVIPVGSVAPLVSQTVMFSAAVNSGDALGTSYINNVTLEADNIQPVVLAPTSVFLGTAGVIYDGTVGPSKPIAGAQIQIVDPNTALPITPSGVAMSPNARNVNPFVTAADGIYAFGLSAQQWGNAGSTATYDILISDPGYLNRKIQAVLTPDASGFYYSVTLTALDGQALALAGGYGLTKLNVTLNDIYGLFGNFPLFTPNVITVTKTADRSTASGGDRILFTVNFSGNGTAQLNQTQIVDTLPPGLVYGPGSGRLDGAPMEPAREGRVLTWSLPTLSMAHVITYATVVLPTVTPGTKVTNAVTINAVLPFDPNTVTSASALCDVAITAGLFSDRIIITGRVFSDIAGTGRFARGDSGVGGVRIYLENGESVLTDENGRFTFPAARPGMHVMRLDVTTLPKTVGPYDDRAYDSERSVRRLVHGIFDSGLMEDVNFALRPVSP